MSKRMSESYDDPAEVELAMSCFRYFGEFAAAAFEEPSVPLDAGAAQDEDARSAPQPAAAHAGPDSAGLADSGSYDFIISVTGRSRARCLHSAGGCYRAKALNFAQFEVFSGKVLPVQYTNVCKLCWKQSPATMLGNEGANDDEEDTSSSSSGSS